MIIIVIKRRKKKRELELAAKRDNLEMKELGKVIAGKLFTDYRLLDKLIPLACKSLLFTWTLTL